MGYSCPVCETPQHDSEHLANHLAMTAMLHEDDHEAWLDDHVEGWGDLTPPELGNRVVTAAEEVDYDEAAVEAADLPESEPNADSHDHSHEHDHAVPDAEAATTAGRGADSLDDEAEAVLEEAREMTRERLERAAEDETAAEEHDEDA